MSIASARHVHTSRRLLTQSGPKRCKQVLWVSLPPHVGAWGNWEPVCSWHWAHYMLICSASSGSPSIGFTFLTVVYYGESLRSQFCCYLIYRNDTRLATLQHKLPSVPVDSARESWSRFSEFRIIISNKHTEASFFQAFRDVSTGRNSCPRILQEVWWTKKLRYRSRPWPWVDKIVEIALQIRLWSTRAGCSIYQNLNLSLLLYWAQGNATTRWK